MTNDHARFSLRNGIIIVEYLTKVYHDKEKATACLSDFNNFIESLGLTNVPVLIKLNNNLKFSLEGRKVLASKEATKHVSSISIIVSNVLNELLGNLYIQIGKPDVNAKLHRNEDVAINWLQDQQTPVNILV